MSEPAGRAVTPAGLPAAARRGRCGCPGPAGESAATGAACRCGQLRRHRHGFPGPAALHRRGGPLRRAAGWALAVVLAGLGSLGAMLGAGLSLVGLCCGGPALTAAGAGAAGAAAAAAAPGEPAAAWLLLAAGAALLTAAAWVYRRQAARHRGSAAGRCRRSARAPGPEAGDCSTIVSKKSILP